MPLVNNELPRAIVTQGTILNLSLAFYQERVFTFIYDIHGTMPNAIRA